MAALRVKYATPVFGSQPPGVAYRNARTMHRPDRPGLYGAASSCMCFRSSTRWKQNAGDREFLLVALVHDLGKVLLLTDESPENVVCLNGP